MNGITQTLHEQLTQLLMDNGAAVTKKSIDALIHFISVRDGETISRVINESERVLAIMQTETRTIEEPTHE